MLAEIEELRLKALKNPNYAIRYTRSDGSSWTLGLDELMQRIAAFEMAYNPNDCPEVRWGAPAGSEEASTCQTRADAGQQERMDAYRFWFAQRQRPVRGDVGPIAPPEDPP